MNFPRIIQGGMGVGVSGWALARAVAEQGQIGVVSGTALDLVMARQLQRGDPGGHLRRGLAAFPAPSLAERVLERYFVEGGIPEDRPFRSKPMVGQLRGSELDALLVVANFVEVYLAKEGRGNCDSEFDGGLIGINFLQKIQAPLLPSLYGAMLAGVDIVIVGAGIPLEIPRILNTLSASEVTSDTLHVAGTTHAGPHTVRFDPVECLGEPHEAPRRPLFFPIVSSVTLASLLVKKTRGQIDGLIVENATAGGHNAPPRGKERSEDGQPIYGPRDEIDLEAIRALGVPFWLAGSFGSPEGLERALDAGASGVQVGTLFAFCEQSGLRPDLRRRVTDRSREPHVFTDAVASPTGFPFKVLSIPGTLSDPELYSDRVRQCDLGYLREAFERPDGSIGWRCAAEDPETYEKRGGSPMETVGRKCLCNGLMANIGLAQLRPDGSEELPLLTCGDDLGGVLDLAASRGGAYSAGDVIDSILATGASHH